METYKIIHDEAVLKEFVDWLPELGKLEKYYIALLGRKKYHPGCTYDRQQLKRSLVTKENIINKLRQMECVLGAYQNKDGSAIPQEGLALYISPNPRSMEKATKAAIKALVDCIGKEDYNPVSEIINCVQQSKNKSHFCIFDIDDKNEEVLNEALEIAPGSSYIRTRGGFHILVDPAKQKSKDWHQKLTKISDVTKDCLSPLPGCCQGGYVPSFCI